MVWQSVKTEKYIQMKIEQISLLHLGSHLMSDGGNVSSAIRLIEINDKGFRFCRCHSYYNSEEFFLNKDALIKSHWVLVPIGTQLTLL